MSEDSKTSESIPAIIFPLTGVMYSPMCQLIGAVTIAWNDAHEQIFRLFWRVSGMPKEAAEAVFFSFKSDNAQREMTRLLVECSQTYPDEHKSHALEWIANLNRKSGQRNAAIHTMWDSKSFLDGKVESTKEINEKYFNRKLSEDIISQFGTLVNDLFRITIELCKAVKIFEILNTDTVADVKKITPEEFARFSHVPRFAGVENVQPSGVEDRLK